ncbi:MAG TPA: ABC transporter permease [Terriglobales bacterium]|nr:ABC transporter permease [Terriglobales bacterium]
MNTQSNRVSQSFEANRNAPAVMSATRPIYWSIRREFWENRYLYIAPLAVAAVFLFGFLISSIHSPGQLRALLSLETAHNHEEISGPFDISAALLMGTAILMSLFYCADALHGERRDRSILFWKSLPVSDATTVLVKASIPLLILPVLVSAITAAMQFFMLLLSSIVLLGTGGNVATLWAHLPIFRMSLLTLYHLLTAHALWPAPVYCWLLLVSGWARRATFLWAALPIIAIGGLEKIAFNSTHFVALVGSRFIGSTATIASTDVFPSNPMTHITPAAFLGAPGLWIGLAVAAAFLAAAIRLRRYQGPI